MLIDTHAHLFDEQFSRDLPEVLARAEAAGVQRVICIGIDRESSLASVRIANEHPLVVAAVGIQPNHAAEAEPSDWAVIEGLAAEPRVVAIGETGLDRYWDRTPFAVQEDYFARHMDLARRVNKPFVIHCREAEADVLRMLRAEFDAHGPIRAVMHSFAGDLATAQACLGMGLFISFAGMLTYKSAEALRDVAKEIPLDRLLVETDCPYLAPVPNRGKRNEPAFVADTARLLAKLKGVSEAEIGEITTRNAKLLFPGIGA
jgi:TatD DNase family protein